MTELKTFKIEQEFNGLEDFYNCLFKDIRFIEEAINIKIQKPLQARMHCMTGKEKITERNILFFASKSDFVESLGELIVLASVYDANIIVVFVNNLDKNYLNCINWLQGICNEDTQFILGEILF